MARLVEVNRLPGNGNLIIAGRVAAGPRRAAAASTSGGKRYHRVVTGDTLSGIAARYGVSQDAVARANHLPSSNIVRLGASLVIPGGSSSGSSSSGGSTSGGSSSSSSSSNTFAGRTYSSSVVGAAARNRAVAGPPQPAVAVRHAGHHRRARRAPTGSTRRWRWP